MLKAPSRSMRNREAQQRQRPFNNGLLQRFGCAVILAMLLIAMRPSADANAQSPDFDQQLIELVNEWRASQGLDLYVANADLSARALDWSQFMARGRGDCDDAGGTNYVHSDTSELSSVDLPGTVGFGENLNWVCGPSNGTTAPWSNAAGPLPDYCKPTIDGHSPEALMCSWLGSAPHRTTIENQRLTHMGSGTVTVGSGNVTQTYSTHVFTTSALPRFDPNCDGTVSLQDAIAIAQYTVGTRTAVGSCALADGTRQINGTKSDLNSDGVINILDAYLAAQCTVGTIDCS